MAMIILNNSAANMTLGQLNKNITKVGKELKKISRGERITSAGDNASDYGISETMRVQIRSLEQDIQNVQNGSSMLKTAFGGINDIVDELRSLKELAINAANDSNSDEDRAVLQRDFDQKRATIDEIATWTNYNTKPLLDGTYAKHTLSAEEEALTKGQPKEPTGNTTTINGNFTINNDGVYQLSESCANATIIINSSNVKIMGSGGTNNNVKITCQMPTNLWLQDYNVNTPSGSMIRFNGTGNTLSLKGTNVLSGSGDNEATINIGGGLTIYGDDDGSLTTGRGAFTGGAIIGTDRDDKNSTNSYIIINSGNINADGSQIGAAIGAGNGGTVGDITINGGTIRAVAGAGTPAIGTGGVTGGGSAGTITINGGDITVLNSGGGRGSNEMVGASYGATIKGLKFNGGKISITNTNPQPGCVAVNPNYNLPGTLSDDNRTYEQDLPNLSSDEISSRIKQWNDSPLTIHHGPHANERTNFFINDMHSEAMGINEAEVTTVPKANTAIGLVDSAIEYALNEATNVGAYLQRLEYTEANVTTESENTQGSESTIRDADMAKEMTEYTKNNVLSQAAQSMLAQANQNLSGVLSLLQ